MTRLAKLQHVEFARLLGLEPAGKERGPILVSSHVPGSRLSDVLEMTGHGLVAFESGAGLQVLRDVLGALAVLHDSRNVAHGSELRRLRVGGLHRRSGAGLVLHA